MAERIRTDQAKDILGIPLRTVQQLARQGVLPSAAQYRRAWTFNEAALRAYVAAQEEIVRRRTGTCSPLPATTLGPVAQPPTNSCQADYEAALGLRPKGVVSAPSRRTR